MRTENFISFDQLLNIQRFHGDKRLILKRADSKLELRATIIAVILFIPTVTISIWVLLLFLFIKRLFSKNMLIKNTATRERFIVTKNDYKQYKLQMKRKNKINNELTTVNQINSLSNELPINNTDDNQVNIIETNEDNSFISNSEIVAPSPPSLTSIAPANINELPKKYPKLIAKSNFSNTYEEEHAIFEYIDFKVAGTSFYQSAIKSAIKSELEEDPFFEKYCGMTNKEILEETIDEPIFQYQDLLLSECALKLEPDNEYDNKSIAIYIGTEKVGHVPKKNFKEGKDYIYDKLFSGEKIHITLTIKDGKYKVNRDDNKVSTGETDYRLEGQIVIKTDKHAVNNM